MVHRALRPFIDLSKRLSVYRESLAQGPLTRMITYVTLCCLARTLPEVLDTPELTPRQPPCMQACSVDGPQLLPASVEPSGAAKDTGGVLLHAKPDVHAVSRRYVTSRTSLRLQDARSDGQHRCAAAEHARGKTRPSQYRRSR